MAMNSGIYDDLKSPLEGLRNYTNGQTLDTVLNPAGHILNGDVKISPEELKAIDLSYDDDSMDTAQAATELAKFAGIRFLTTLIACPFTISQTLLQVQHLPTAVKHEEQSNSTQGDDATSEVGVDDEKTEVPDPDDPAYYEYLRARHSGRAMPYRQPARAQVDRNGYVVDGWARETVGFRAGYQLSPLPEAKLSVLRRLVAHPTEGVLSLFKGSFAQWTYTMLHLLLQPTLEGVLNEMLGLYDGAPLSMYIDASAPSALTLVASNAVVGWLLSPLELVRTRLMIQSASPIHRKYRGTVHALRTVAREEGGLTALYLSPYHVVPTLIKHTLDAVFRDMGTFVLDRVAGIDPYDHPTTFALGDLLWKTLSALVMLPIDTIRTRLQAQPRYTHKPATEGAKYLTKSAAAKDSDTDVNSVKEFRTCVPLAPVPYTGMANCAWRMITEEGESLKQIRKRQAAARVAAMSGSEDRLKQQQISNVGRYGLRALYPGITLQLAANVAIFGLSFMTTEELDDGF
ncbi:hypothetical protein GGI07_002191 [Coemansia sp. Benny D115]|nr:hypothetical protein GGI07_002191 [Coemansia sp. Benny D115]